MINVSLDALGWFVILVFLSSAVGVSVSSALPWTRQSIKTNLPLSFGLLLGPFILGLFVIILLWFGLTDQFRVIEDVIFKPFLSLISFSLVVIFALSFFWRKRFRIILIAPKGAALQWLEFIAFLLVGLWCIVLLINSVSLPLIQNDSLEYALVGQIIFDTFSLKHYPAIHSEQYESGFYGPWTHPPLYVGFIFLTNYIQDGATIPGLMRLIAPWFCFATTILIYSLGARFSRLTGLLAAIIFISTPLYFLGVDSALIDALPVAGCALVLAAIIGLDRSSKWYFAVIGVAAGFALWTHSEAILIVPIALFILFMVAAFGSPAKRNLLSIFVQPLQFLLLALLIGVWWYVRNYFVFGAPVSDNPVVFAIPELDWKGYFSTARGLDNWPAIVQYGWFKGWFSFEAYALGFWLMSFGVLIYARAWLKNHEEPLSIIHILDIRQHHPVVWVCFLAIACYLSGVVISTLLGMELLIKNERYLLFIMPAVALIAGLALEKILLCFLNAKASTEPLGNAKNNFLKLCVVGTAIVAIMQLLLVAGVYRWRSYQDLSLTKPVYITHGTISLLNKAGYASLPSINEPKGVSKKLKYWSNMRAISWMNEHISDSALVFSLRPADMFYSNNKMLSYLDPRLEQFYKETSTEAAVKLLEELQIDYIQVSNYSLPVQYNSVLNRILADNRYARLIYSDQGNQIYQLQNNLAREEALPQSQNLTPGVIPWTAVDRTILGGRKGLSQLGANVEPVLDFEESISNPPLGLFHRDVSRILYSGLGENAFDGLASTFTQVREGEYLLSMDIEGYGLVRIYILEYDQAGSLILNKEDRVGVYRFDEFVLDYKGNKHTREFTKRVNFYPDTKYIRVAVEHLGNSSISIKKATLRSL